MAGAAGPNTAESGLVFAYDLGNTETSYIGEPSTNLALFSMQGSFNVDYAGVTFVDDPGKGYQGRDAKRITANSGQWNIYRYPRSGNYTATSSGQFTYSFKIKWADGHTPYFSNGYIYVDAVTTYPSITVRAIDDGWFWCYCTYNGTSSPPWLTGFSTSDNGVCWVCDWQLEPGLLHPTPYITPGGTRSATQGLLNLGGTDTINITNASFNNNAQLIFDGTNDYVYLTSFNPTFTTGITMECVAKWTANPGGSWQRMFDFGNGSNADNLIFCRYSNGDQLFFGIYNGSGNSYNTTGTGAILFGQYAHYVAVADGTDFKVYVNGQLIFSGANSTIPVTTSRTNNYIGKSNWADSYFDGEIPVAKMYTKALTAAEVQQNYQALRYRFGI